MTALRVDVVRKNANAAITAIADATEHIEDLHAIGWYRHADQAARERVAASSRSDWCLDNNGDPKARAAYEQLAGALIQIHRTARDAVDGALAIFDSGLVRARRDQTADATATEVIAALGRQQKRHRQGEYTSTALTPQPLPNGARTLMRTAALQDELDDLRNAVRKTGQRADRRRLTPREQDAWNRAFGTTKGKRKKAHTP